MSMEILYQLTIVEAYRIIKFFSSLIFQINQQMLVLFFTHIIVSFQQFRHQIHYLNFCQSSQVRIQLIQKLDGQQYSLMGSYNSKQQQLQYYSQYQNSTYGKGSLYSSNKFPNCYIMKTLHLMSDQNIFKLYSEIENNQNIYLLSLYGYIFGKSCQCDQENFVKRCVITYWEFLSFSLKDCIEYRKRIGVPFHENQIWHIIKASIFGYITFQRTNVYYDFQEDLLLLNHEGRVRLSWQHIQNRNEHMKYYKIQRQFRRLLEQQRATNLNEDKFSNIRNILWMKIINQQFYYSPEELRSIGTFEFTRKINFSQCNIFSLGMMLLHVCALSHPIETYYNYYTVDYAKINFIMSTQLSRHYSHNLLLLIGQMLNQNPHNRITAEAIRDIYGPLMRGQFQINLSANRDIKKSIKQSKHLN